MENNSLKDKIVFLILSVLSRFLYMVYIPLHIIKNIILISFIQ